MHEKNLLFSKFCCKDIKTSKIMETEMTLHQAKMNLLRVVDGIRTIDDVQAIQQILANYYAQKAEAEMDRLWDNGTINEQVIEQWGQEHMRTPYNHAQ